MLAYGYEWSGEETGPMTLRETSLVCTPEELDQLIEMLQKARREAVKRASEEGGHWHFRDWSEDWSEKESDFILFITPERYKKEN